MLSSRENQILRAIVNEYITSAHPVGSQLLWSRYGFGVSPATIRNVMGALTEAGYLSQPHTSAGRVPTDRAYRRFVENTEAGTPSVGEREKLRSRLAKAESPSAALNSFAQQLSEISGGVGVALDESGVRLYGLTNAFGQPEFADPRIAAYLAEMLDGVSEWLPNMADTTNQLAIRIGQEHEDFRAQAISVLGTKVKTGTFEGQVAVVGPTRMPYRKLVALIEYATKEFKETNG